MELTACVVVVAGLAFGAWVGSVALWLGRGSDHA